MPDLPPITFEHFLLSLSTAALFHMGEIPDPETKQKKLDLVQAKQSIDILGLIHEKTKGNLTSAEQMLLERMLAELRMRFVQLTPP